MTHIKVFKTKHRGNDVLRLSFPRDLDVEAKIRAIKQSRWSETLHSWYLPHSKHYLLKLRQLFSDSLEICFEDHGLILLNPEQESAIEKFKKWLKSRRYSENTIQTYTDAMKVFLHFFKTKPITELDHTDFIEFNNAYLLAKAYSSSYQNQVVNAIKLFFRTVENRKLDLELVHRPKREKTLPHILSKEEVKALLEALENPKHRMMLTMIYAFGLRRSELLALKPTDIDSARGVVHIRCAKGKKDRDVGLSEKVLILLREYYVAYRPKIWLFEGQEAGQPYSSRSLEQVLKKATRLAKIKKPVTLHWLRHSYATHLLEEGVNLRYIQELLGHKSSKTTEIYTHVSTKQLKKIKSPFDDL